MRNPLNNQPSRRSQRMNPRAYPQNPREEERRAGAPNREWDDYSYDYSPEKNEDYGYQQDLTYSGQRRSQNWDNARMDESRLDYNNEPPRGDYGGRTYQRDVDYRQGFQPQGLSSYAQQNFSAPPRPGTGNFSQGYDQSYGQSDRYDQSYARNYPPRRPYGGFEEAQGYSEEEQPHFNTAAPGSGGGVNTWNRPTISSRNWEGNTQQPPYRPMPNAGTTYGSYAGPQQAPQNFYGKGPKGFKRSDERIKEDVSEMLTRHSEIDASDIEVEVNEGEVILKGETSDRRTKLLAEDLVEKCMGVKDVVNQIRIKKQSDVNVAMDREGKTPKRGTPPSH